ncbi:MAG: DUF1552 domain-containing protein [Planctomycetaceae bacterium]|nr:DUF1552 domain-containing protein [Planctomycetaceae bacterium]
MRRSISRRTVLRGIGASVSLPFLDAMIPGQAFGAKATTELPRRIGFFFVPNGVNLAEWTPKKTGYDYDLPSILEPLHRVKNDVNVLTGLTQDKGRANGDGAGDHARSASTFLTGAQPRKTSAGNIRVGISVDQVAAQAVGNATRFPSLELGCDRTRNSGNCDSGYSCAYSHNISWSSATTPMAKEIDPRLVFERLFGGDQAKDQEAQTERQQLRKSLLDYVRDDARRLQNRLGRSDQIKLDQYVTGVREIERRIEASEQDTQRYEVEFEKPDGIPRDYAEHVRLMSDMMVLAFQADLTRVSSCMFANAGSNRSYREIDVPDGHHDLSHHGGNAEKLEKIRRINQYHIRQFAYFLERMKSIPEGDGSLLDNCMIVYGSGLSDGNRHNNENLPLLVAGRGGGTVETGRHVVYDVETPLNNLYLAMLDRIGVSVPRLGDSTSRLPYLS